MTENNKLIFLPTDPKFFKALQYLHTYSLFWLNISTFISVKLWKNIYGLKLTDLFTHIWAEIHFLFIFL